MNVPPGLKVKTLVLLVPLFKVTPALFLRLVTELAPRVKFAFPTLLNVIVPPAVTPFVLKSKVPLFTKFPPITNECVKTVPVAADLIEAPAEIVTSVTTVSVLPVTTEYTKSP